MRKKLPVEEINDLDLEQCINDEVPTGSASDLKFAIICEWSTSYNYLLSNKNDLSKNILGSLSGNNCSYEDSWVVRVVNENGYEVDWQEETTITIKINKY